MNSKREMPRALGPLFLAETIAVGFGASVSVPLLCACSSELLDFARRQ